jgi:predicted metal-dependent phosphoesterase TrpH
MVDGFEVFWGDYAPDMLLADLHVHTRRSDGWWSPERLAERAVERGLSAIGITDHDDIRAGYAIADYCSRRGLPLRVYPGSEVSAWCEPAHVCGRHDLHVLGLDLVEEVPPWRSFQETVETILKQGGFVVIPHPKTPGRGFPTYDHVLSLGYPVAVEIYNSTDRDMHAFRRRRGDPDANTLARAFYEANRDRLGAATGSSDSHFRTIARGMTAYRGDLRQALEARETAVVYRPERERLKPWDLVGYFGGLRRLAHRREAVYGPRPR